MSAAACSVSDCVGVAGTRGLCRKHYERWRVHGDPTVNNRTRPVLDRLVDKVEPDGDCWLFTGSTDAHGYGRIGKGRRTYLAHRVAYEELVGPIPEGLTLDHLCRRPSCVNPDHLEPVTHRTNVMRGVAPSVRAARSNTCNRGHQFTGENTYVNAQGHRSCKTCRRAAWQAWCARQVVGA